MLLARPLARFLLPVVSTIAALLAVPPPCAALPRDSGSPTVVLNEFVSSNSTGLVDEDGDHSDWIELFNAGAEPAALEGWGLTDNPASPFKWTFPAVTLTPGQFQVVFASSKNRLGAELHASFSISAGGEKLVLTSPQGTTVDEAPATAMPANVSLGRQPDAVGPWYYFDAPTPAATNGSGGYLGSGPVAFSHDGGAYPDPFALELSAEGDSVIHYTLDGSTPDKDSPVYSAPIAVTDRAGDPNVFSLIRSSPEDLWKEPEGEIRKATVVRAIAIRPGVGAGPVLTHTYFVGADAAGGANLPVFSIAVDEDDFWDYERGIYVPGKVYDDLFDPTLPSYRRQANYNQRGDAWERPASVEMFEADGSEAIRQNIGLRINGGATRAWPRKSLRLYARSDYGTSTFEHAFFPGSPITSFKRVLLRNSGNDFHKTLFRDAMMQSLVGGTGLATQASRAAVVFVNGEYWGLYYLTERMDQYYLASHYGVDPDAVDLLSGDAEVDQGDATHYLAMRSFVTSHDLSVAANYDYVTTQMDVDDFITYFAAEIYFRNHDWPQNNIDYWRPRTPDGRWRWLLYDTDFGFGYDGNPEAWKYDSLKRVAVDELNGHTRMFQALLASPVFRTKFLVRYADLMNTVFLPDVVIARIDAMEDEIAPLVPEHIERWREPPSTSDWHNEVQALRVFATERPDYARSAAVALFGLSGTATVTVGNDTPERGTLRIGTVDLAEVALPWSGVYFRGVPVVVQGSAAPGFRFAGFEGLPASDDGRVEFVPESDTGLDAIFEEVCGDGLPTEGEPCDDGNTAAGDGCSADCRLTGSCPASPLAGCLAADVARLSLGEGNRNPLRDTTDRGRYVWSRGESEGPASFGNPLDPSTTMSWCVFDGDELVLGFDVAGGGTGWRTTSNGGFSFHGEAGGATRIKLRSGAASSLLVRVKDKDGSFAVPPLPLSEPVTSQFVIDDEDGTSCFGSTFTGAPWNERLRYRATAH